MPAWAIRFPKSRREISSHNYPALRRCLSVSRACRLTYTRHTTHEGHSRPNRYTGQADSDLVCNGHIRDTHPPLLPLPFLRSDCSPALLNRGTHGRQPLLFFALVTPSLISEIRSIPPHRYGRMIPTHPYRGFPSIDERLAPFTARIPSSRSIGVVRDTSIRVDVRGEVNVPKTMNSR